MLRPILVRPILGAVPFGQRDFFDLGARRRGELEDRVGHGAVGDFAGGQFAAFAPRLILSRCREQGFAALHQIEQLRALHEAMGAAVAADDGNAYGKYNMAFHFEIYRIADNKTLATLIEALWLRMAPFVSRTRSLITSDAGEAWQVACGSHEALLTAMQTRDAEAARAAMRADLSALSKIDGYWEGIDEPS